MSNNRMIPLFAVMTAMLFSGCITSMKNRTSNCPNHDNYEIPAVPGSSAESAPLYESYPAQENGGFELPPTPSETSAEIPTNKAQTTSAIQAKSSSDFETVAPKTNTVRLNSTNQAAPPRSINLFE